MPQDATARPFGVQFDEAIAYLRGKLPEVSLAWDDLAGPVHAKVFTVAGAVKADLVRDLHQAVIDAIEQGQTITTFRKAFDQAVQRHGWSYNGKRGWRTRVIFDTNMRAAHMAGRWKQIEAVKKERPYLQYRTAGDARVRPQHRQWNGAIYPVDDAFWDTHYPPNGWGCRCTVRSYSLEDLQAKNLRVSEPFKVTYRDVGTATGPLRDRVPVGIDPGWDHNVGKSWISPELALGAKLATLPAELRGPVTDNSVSPAFQQVIAANWKAFNEARPVAVKGPGGELIRQKVHLRGDLQVLGFLDSASLDGLAQHVPELKLRSSAIVGVDYNLWHVTGGHKGKRKPFQAWPEDMRHELPVLLRAYRAVLWDKLDEVLVVVPLGGMPQAPGRHPKIVMRPNQSTRMGQALELVSLGSAQPADLTDPNRYITLVGKVD